jgi:hypothetical protein
MIPQRNRATDRVEVTSEAVGSGEHMHFHSQNAEVLTGAQNRFEAGWFGDISLQTTAGQQNGRCKCTICVSSADNDF